MLRNKLAGLAAMKLTISLCLAASCVQILSSNAADSKPGLRFEVSVSEKINANPGDGRLLILLARDNKIQPRLMLGHSGLQGPQGIGRDVTNLAPGKPAIVDQTAYTSPATNFSAIPTGEYFVQALFDANRDLRLRNAPGNLYSKVQKLRIDPAENRTVGLELTEQIPAEKLPKETDFVKYIRFESGLLSKFYRRPIFLRAGIVLPRDYAKETMRHYPLWVRIGGLNTRYTAVSSMIDTPSRFREAWLADETPRFILVQLDGAGPFGDPYYVNSENNGPFGDALTQELIPHIEERFRGMSPGKRVLSGTSTGGWVSLALQIFYPDYFAGAWSSCPDPVDFRALELINLYEDDNAFADPKGKERPSERNPQGNVTLTVRQEIRSENVLGRNNCYTTSGEQWGECAASFSPRGRDGLPAPIWDPNTGKIDREIANYWKRYDLRLYLEQHWSDLAPKLRGKLHIASGEADQFYLNYAVHLLDRWLAEQTPSIEAKIVFGPGKSHGWFDLSQLEMLKEMETAVRRQ